MNCAPINLLHSTLVPPFVPFFFWGGGRFCIVKSCNPAFPNLYIFIKRISKPRPTTKPKKYRKGKVRSDKKNKKGKVRSEKKRKESTIYSLLQLCLN